MTVMLGEKNKYIIGLLLVFYFTFNPGISHANEDMAIQNLKKTVVDSVTISHYKDEVLLKAQILYKLLMNTKVQILNEFDMAWRIYEYNNLRTMSRPRFINGTPLYMNIMEITKAKKLQITKVGGSDYSPILKLSIPKPDTKMIFGDTAIELNEINSIINNRFKNLYVNDDEYYTFLTPRLNVTDNKIKTYVDNKSAQGDTILFTKNLTFDATRYKLHFFPGKRINFSGNNFLFFTEMTSLAEALTLIQQGKCSTPDLLINNINQGTQTFVGQIKGLKNISLENGSTYANPTETEHIKIVAAKSAFKDLVYRINPVYYNNSIIRYQDFADPEDNHIDKRFLRTNNSSGATIIQPFLGLSNISISNLMLNGKKAVTSDGANFVINPDNSWNNVKIIGKANIDDLNVHNTTTVQDGMIIEDDISITNLYANSILTGNPTCQTSETAISPKEFFAIMEELYAKFNIIQSIRYRKGFFDALVQMLGK